MEIRTIASLSFELFERSSSEGEVEAFLLLNVSALRRRLGLMILGMHKLKEEVDRDRGWELKVNDSL